LSRKSSIARRIGITNVILGAISRANRTSYWLRGWYLWALCNDI